MRRRRLRLPSRWERVPGWLVGWVAYLGGIAEAILHHQPRSAG